MKIIFCFIGLFMLSGCGRCQRQYTYYVGGLTYKCSNQGVEYVQSDSGIAASLDRSGKPVPCGED